MKGHKAAHHGRKHRSMGGVNEAAEDLRMKPEARDNAREIEHEAEETEGKKHGGRTKRKHGGMIHHEKMEHMKHAKHIGKIHGEHAMHHSGRKPRKSGGRTGSEAHPFSSALHGTPAKGRKLQKETMGLDE